MFHKFADELFQLISHPDTSAGHILRCLQVLFIQYDRLLDARTETAIVNTIMSGHCVQDASLPPEGRSALQGAIIRVVESRERYGMLERSSTKALWDLKKKCKEVGMMVYLQAAVVAREFNLHAMPHVKFDVPRCDDLYVADTDTQGALAESRIAESQMVRLETRRTKC